MESKATKSYKDSPAPAPAAGPVPGKTPMEEEKKTACSVVKPLADYEERHRRLVSRMAADREVDICYCLDITGSMERFMDMVKAKLKDITETLSTSLGITARLAFLGYRDKQDGSKQFETTDFTTDVDAMKARINTINCDGGAD